MTGAHAYLRHGDSASRRVEDWNAPARDLNRDANLRQQAVQRMRYMSVRHAMHAWEQRYSDPIAPYGLAFLYAQPDQDRLTLKAATKLWLAGPEAADLPRLLFNLNHAVTQRVGDPVLDSDFDVRRDLANRVDEQMTQDAWYIGLGVSSLDTCSGTWEHACATLDGYGDVPAEIRIVLTDATMIVCDRRGLADFNTLTVHATHALSLSLIDAPYPWSAVTARQLRDDPAHSVVLRWMEELNLSLWRADNARLVARQHERELRSRRRPS